MLIWFYKSNFYQLVRFTVDNRFTKQASQTCLKKYRQHSRLIVLIPRLIILCKLYLKKYKLYFDLIIIVNGKNTGVPNPFLSTCLQISKLKYLKYLFSFYGSPSWSLLIQYFLGLHNILIFQAIFFSIKLYITL
jgi:hypothetical protein